MNIILFKRGDLVIDAARNLHGLIVEVGLKSVTVKWANKPMIKEYRKEQLMLNSYLRQKIMDGTYLYNEKANK